MMSHQLLGELDSSKLVCSLQSAGTSGSQEPRSGFLSVQTTGSEESSWRLSPLSVEQACPDFTQVSGPRKRKRGPTKGLIWVTCSALVST